MTMHDTQANDMQPNDPQASDDPIQLTVDGGIARITLNRAERRNALTFALWQRLGDTFDALSAEREIRAIVLTGSANSFCAGADISEFGKVRANAEQARAYENAYEGCCNRIAASPKPTIAAINGYCMGGGCNVAMSCDFRFAVPGAKFAIPAAKLSIVYGIAGTRRLLSLVGLANAKRILYAAETFDAERALRIGFIDEITDDPLAAALAFAQRLNACAPLTISGAKTILDALASGNGALRDGVVERLLDEAAQSDDFREGRAAFAEKRAPKFRGK
jgi:enoyl-CoA hydratase/carnithine racemase